MTRDADASASAVAAAAAARPTCTSITHLYQSHAGLALGARPRYGLDGFFDMLRSRSRN